MFGNDVLFLQRFLKSMGFYKGPLDGRFGDLTNTALNEFEDETDKISIAHGRFDLRSEKNIITLELKAQVLARQFLADVIGIPSLKANGVTVKIISGTRTYAEQSDLYAQGRTRPGRIVTKASAGHSNHNFGIAWDIGLFKGSEYLDESPLYDDVGKVGKKLGLEWGGDWSSIIDKPHYQLAIGLTIAELREKFEIGNAFV